jgi:hypothetical protein
VFCQQRSVHVVGYYRSLHRKKFLAPQWSTSGVSCAPCAALCVLSAAEEAARWFLWSCCVYDHAMLQWLVVQRGSAARQCACAAAVKLCCSSIMQHSLLIGSAAMLQMFVVGMCVCVGFFNLQSCSCTSSSCVCDAYVDQHC